MCKIEAQLEHIHIAYTFFARFGADLYAQSVLINKISASELTRKFTDWLSVHQSENSSKTSRLIFLGSDIECVIISLVYCRGLRHRVPSLLIMATFSTLVHTHTRARARAQMCDLPKEEEGKPLPSAPFAPPPF